MRQRIISFLIIALASIGHAYAAESATQLINRAAKTISTAPSVSTKYTIMASDGSKTIGAMTISGNRFLMATDQIKVWYDGKTQWTYMPSAQEVNITEPTSEELQQINPISIINSFKSNYTVSPSKNTATESTIELKANNKNAEIKMVTLTLNKSTALPSRIILKMSSGQTATIQINSISIGKKLSDASFRFPKSNYPKAEIIDLR